MTLTEALLVAAFPFALMLYLAQTLRIYRARRADYKRRSQP